jgi:hypothetical protein
MAFSQQINWKQLITGMVIGGIIGLGIFSMFVFGVDAIRRPADSYSAGRSDGWRSFLSHALPEPKKQFYPRGALRIFGAGVCSRIMDRNRSGPGRHNVELIISSWILFSTLRIFPNNPAGRRIACV